MKPTIRQVIRDTPFYYTVRGQLMKRRQRSELREWERKGRPVPPPHIVKQRTLIDYADKYGLRTLVETGTCLGDMVEAMKRRFDRIYSIELSKELYDRARARFAKAHNIELILGDSGKVLESVVKEIDHPALFWLDSHYSAGITARGEKDTPIYEELCHILQANARHIIIIDDARCFGADPAYPTMEELCNFVRSKSENAEITVQYDSIRVTPRS